ncbi:hypothetical protein SISNIDRAFT_549997 [Sistotremastrum niveocremeum HHB9708]|uniref:Uncharacterized protein n=2 Tax=Sistotremastraceae TaxID=3402574 RepID=A0A164U6W9_9AGAM|nr:hypothetical protein SISNIDRAFT_549997 [Sistotremastrum niveocremeum HHB9708]KZT44356.1 hypothetical protein SISSUDRAFT_1123896 [Sistotremastrum suecicum HHB10207 ss-3]
MGSLCSKSTDHTGGHQVLSSNESGQPVRPTKPDDRRAALAEAAENRLKAQQARGTNASNPNKGKLAQKVTESTKLPPATSREEEPIRWD